MAQRSYKELYSKALMMLECFSLRYEEPPHTKEEWDNVIDNTEQKDIEDYIKELKGEDGLGKN